ncbi:MAG: potassium transporter TrkG [Tissierellia bacterium]|nr:potassium transporter TrkG [Tissierellia bacterium]
MKKDLFKLMFGTKNPAKLIFNVYLLLIFFGSIVLWLPISSESGQFTNFIDAFFTTTSSLCVTGLSTVTTAQHWNLFGKIFILILIQLGGLGVMTAAAAVGLILNKKITVTQRMNLAEEKNTLTISGIIRLLKYIFVATFLIEMVGAIFLSFTFIPEFGFIKGIWYSLFHSISAFCNAGFDIIGDSSLAPYSGNFGLLFPIMLLIIGGGLGFGVFRDIIGKKFKFSQFALHSKIVVVGTLILVFIPAIIILVLEWNNPQTIGNFSVGKKLLTALFESVTPRTAGFASLDQHSFKATSTMIVILLMFIGGAPAGTAGGFKITTMATIFLIAKANIKNEKDMTIFRRRLPEETARKAVTIFLISWIWIVVTIFVLTMTEGGKSLTDITYEVVSAYGTVGLTRGLTAELSIIGKILISATMVFGKIGPLAMVVAFTNKKAPLAYREAEESIIVG